MANITKRTNKKGETSYRIRVCRGTQADGTPRTWSMTWNPPPDMTAKQAAKEAQRQAIQFEDRIADDLKHGLTGKRVRFQELADEWFELMEATGELKLSSLLRMRNCAARTYQAIGSTFVDEVNYRQVQRFIISLTNDGMNMLTGKGLSAKSQKHHLTFISDVMRYAKRCGLITVNPCQDVSVVKTAEKERVPYTIDEESALLERMAQRGVHIKYQVFFRFLMYCGVRRGEALGLEWHDIDFDTGLCRVCRISTYQNSKTGIYTTTPKTKSSDRTIKLPSELLSILRRLKLEQNTERVNLGDQWHDSDRLFTSYTGTPMQPEHPYTWLKRFCEKEGLPFKGLHNFRHTFASEMISGQQVDVKTVSTILGHSQTSTTLNIYAHELQEATMRAMDVVPNLITAKLNKS